MVRRRVSWRLVFAMLRRAGVVGGMRMQEQQKYLGQAELYLEIDRFLAVLEGAQRVRRDGSVASAREAAKRSLTGAIMFITRAYGPSLGSCLQELLMALDNLDDGTVDPIIQKSDLEQN